VRSIDPFTGELEESVSRILSDTEEEQKESTNREIVPFDNTKSPIVPQKRSIHEVLEFVRNHFVEGTREEWIILAVGTGLPEKDVIPYSARALDHYAKNVNLEVKLNFTEVSLGQEKG
jgi:hypothetical protein